MADFPNEYSDLLDAQFATLATVEPDGTPQLSGIWFLRGQAARQYNADVAAYDRPGDKRVVVTIEPTRVRPVDMSG